MSVTLKLWCSCGGSIVASSNPAYSAVYALDVFRGFHKGDGCAVTDDPKLGAKYRRQARKRDDAIAEANNR